MIKQNFDDTIEVFKKYIKINTAYLCGSYANDTAVESSDVDFAIVTTEKLSLLETMEIQSRLSEKLHFDDLDLIDLCKAPVRLQFSLVSTGKLIYEKEKDLTDIYIENLLKRYHDMEYRFRLFDEDLEKGLREDYCDAG